MKSIACLHFRPLINPALPRVLISVYLLSCSLISPLFSFSLRSAPRPNTRPIDRKLQLRRERPRLSAVRKREPRGAAPRASRDVRRRYAEKICYFYTVDRVFLPRARRRRRGGEALVNPFGILTLTRWEPDTCGRSRSRGEYHVHFPQFHFTWGTLDHCEKFLRNRPGLLWNSRSTLWNSRKPLLPARPASRVIMSFLKCRLINLNIRRNV